MSIEHVDHGLAPVEITDAITSASACLELLYDAGDYEAIARGLVELTPIAKALTDLRNEIQTRLIDIAPWSGDTLELDGLPVLELRTGAKRNEWAWDEIRPYLRRRLLDPEGTGDAPEPMAVAAVDDTLDLLFQVAPLTASTGPRVTQIAPLLAEYDRSVDEFCTTKPGRKTIQVHE